MKFGTINHIPHEINRNHFDDPLAFRLASSTGQTVPRTLANEQIPAKLIRLSCMLCSVLIYKCKHAITLN